MKKIKYLNIDRDTNVYVVGDIHGCYSLLIHKLQELKFNFNKDILIGVGDLVDRGSENELCADLINQHWFTTVKGNHEDFCVQGFSNNNIARCHVASNNGGDWFYDLDDHKQEQLANQFSQLPILLEVNYCNRKFGFVHADLPIHDWNILKENINNKINDRDIEELCLWTRDIVYRQNINIKNIHNVFLGHTVLPKITQVGNCTFLDTGAVFYSKKDTNHLSIINLRDYI